MNRGKDRKSIISQTLSRRTTSFGNVRSRTTKMASNNTETIKKKRRPGEVERKYA